MGKEQFLRFISVHGMAPTYSTDLLQAYIRFGP